MVICVSYIHAIVDNFVCMDNHVMFMLLLHCFVYFVSYFDMFIDLKCRYITIFMRWFWFVILHSMFVMKFGIHHWYILAYLCMYLYWLGIFIIYVHFDKCKYTIWLGWKLIELDTSNRPSSSFWYCQRGRDLDAQAKDE